jgi:hypothetical protein
MSSGRLWCTQMGHSVDMGCCMDCPDCVDRYKGDGLIIEIPAPKSRYDTPSGCNTIRCKYLFTLEEMIQAQEEGQHES